MGDEELSRLKNDLISYSINDAGNTNNNIKNKKSHKYFPIIFDQLFDLCLTYINIESEDEEDDSWNISKACNYILKILVQLVDSEKIDKLLNYIVTNFDNENLLLKNSCLLIFAAAIDSTHKNKICELVRIYYDRILKTIEHENSRIRKSAIYLMLKITKDFGKNLTTNQIESVLTKCVGMINYNNKNSIKLCSIFSNIIKARGDPNTIKNDSKSIKIYLLIKFYNFKYFLLQKIFNI